MSFVSIPPHEAEWRVFFDDVSSRDVLGARLDLLLQHSASVKSCEWSKAEFLHGLSPPPPLSSLTWRIPSLATTEIAEVTSRARDGPRPGTSPCQRAPHVAVSVCVLPIMCQSDIMKTVYIFLQCISIFQTGVWCPTPRRDALCLGWVACPLG